MEEIFSKFLKGFLCLMLMVFFKYAAAQQVDTVKVEAKFKATLVDENTIPLRQVQVVLLNSGKKDTTDRDGIFTLDVKVNDILSFQLNGVEFSTYKIENLKDSIIVINSHNVGLKQQREVRLPFGITTNPNYTASSTDAIYASDVTKVPAISVTSAIRGQLSGLYAVQNTGKPGADGSSLTLRGRSPLILIDGIPRGFTIFNLEEIESVTVLKDALATATLGARAFNGAILITTKRGSKGKQNISFTAQTAFQTPLKQLNPLNAFQYANLYNEAAKNDGLPQPYTQADLNAYATESDPFGHPDVDWRSKVLKDVTKFNQYALNISGGNDWGRYFVALNHIDQDGFFKTIKDNSYNTNTNFSSYVIRSNVDINIDKKLSGGINLLGRILNNNGPGFAVSGLSSTDLILANLNFTPNNAYPVFNPNGSLGTSPNFRSNIYGQVVNTGYTATYNRDVLGDFYIRRTLDELTPGLWIRGAISLYSAIEENNVRLKNFATFYFNPLTQIYTQYGNNTPQTNGNGVTSQSRADYIEFKLGYDRTFNQHKISAVVFANRDNFVAGSDLPYTIRGISGRASYNFDERYTFEMAFGYNGSNYYPPSGNYKYGFFPAAGISWNINKEKFLTNTKWLSDLKLFASYGKNGNDNPGYFQYIQRYFDGPSYFFGSNPGSQTSILEQPLANRNIQIEKANKLNIGLQSAFFQNKLGFKIEYYNNKYYDLLMQRGKNAALIGQNYPNENIGSYRYKGIDINLNWQEELNQDLSYYLAANFNVQNNKVLDIDEVNQPFPWMRRTGQMIGQTFGYIAEGLFQSQAEINAAPKLEGYTAQPGDIKYRDLNGDGLINQFDQTAIGQNKPLIFYGLNFGIKFKSFDLSAIIQGVSNRKIYIDGSNEWPFQLSPSNGIQVFGQSFGQAWQHNLNRWTPENAANATFPRVSLGNNINNYAVSTYWFHSGDYLRVRNIELGYTLPKYLIKKIKLNRARVFVSGTNLLTLASFDRIDPEVNEGAYPIQRVINLGLNVKF